MCTDNGGADRWSQREPTMHLETRLRTCGALALALVGLAILFDSVVVLLGASALCGWLLARSLAFAAELERTLESLHVEQELERTTVRAGATVQHSVTATLATPSRLRLTLEATVPPTATLEGDVPTLALTPGMSAARVSQPLSWPVAGHYDFDGVTITATDGFFRKTISLEQDCSITVETSPAAPTQAKTAGTQFAAASDTSRSRLGTRGHPAYAREYVPGDSLEQIDWKATARLGTTYIREFETATSQPEHLIVDHRGADANTRTAFRQPRSQSSPVHHETAIPSECSFSATMDSPLVSTRPQPTTAIEPSRIGCTNSRPLPRHRQQRTQPTADSPLTGHALISRILVRHRRPTRQLEKMTRSSRCFVRSTTNKSVAPTATIGRSSHSPRHCVSVEVDQ